MLHYWPDSEPFNSGFEASGVESNYFLENVGFVLYIMYGHVLLVVIHAGLYFTRNKFTCCKKLYEKLNAYLYWQGLIRLFMEAFFELLL